MSNRNLAKALLEKHLAERPLEFTEAEFRSFELKHTLREKSFVTAKEKGTVRTPRLELSTSLIASLSPCALADTSPPFEPCCAEKGVLFCAGFSRAWCLVLT